MDAPYRLFYFKLMQRHISPIDRYAGVRVDMRGCGDSTGMVQDEYVLQEQLDAVECIEWIRCQSWCTGKIGMMGISWGGFNSLQVETYYLYIRIEHTFLIYHVLGLNSAIQGH